MIKFKYISLFILILFLAISSVSAVDMELDDNSMAALDSNNGDSNIKTVNDDISVTSVSNLLDESDSVISEDEGADGEEPDGTDENIEEDDFNNTTSISADAISFDYAAEGKLTITLYDSNGTGLADKHISVKIGESSSDLSTDGNGVAVFNFSGNVGTYDVDIYFDGDETYASSYASTKITITKSSTQIKVPDVRGYLTKSTYVTVTLLDSKGNAVANKDITIKVNKIVYTGKTNDKGVLKVQIPTKVGTYDVYVSFAGDSNYYSSSASAKVTITKMKVNLIVPSVRSYMTNNTYLTITLKDVYGNALSKKPITVKVGKKTYSLTTNANGVARLKFTTKVSTSYATVSFKATSYYYGASKNAKVVITRMPSYISANSIKIDSNKYGKIYITLKDVYGNALKYKNIAVNCTATKTVYKLKTNGQGKVTFYFNAPKTTYLTITYLANKKYFYASSTKVKATVNTKRFKFSDVVGAANSLKNYVSKNKELPSYIVYNGKNFTVDQLSYLMAVAINHANKKNYNDIILVATSSPSKNTGEIYDTVYKDNYLKIVNKAIGSSVKHKTPEYITYSIYKVPYRVYTVEFSRALSFFKEKKRLPKYVLFTNSEFAKVTDNGKYTFYLTSDNIRGKKSELKMLKSLRDALKSKGYNAVIVGIGPDIHNIAYRYGCTGKNSVLLAVFGGVDVGCIEEWTGELKNSERSFVDNYKGAHVLGLWFTKPYGASSSVHSRIGRAWDANYGHPLANPAKYMSQHGISYIQTGTVSSACTLLKSGKMGGPKLIS